MDREHPSEPSRPSGTASSTTSEIRKTTTETYEKRTTTETYESRTVTTGGQELPHSARRRPAIGTSGGRIGCG